MILNCASEPEMQLVLCVKIAGENNLSWPEVRAIVQCFTLGDRGSAMSVATFKSLEKKLKEKVGKEQSHYSYDEAIQVGERILCRGDHQVLL